MENARNAEGAEAQAIEKVTAGIPQEAKDYGKTKATLIETGSAIEETDDIERASLQTEKAITGS